MTMPSGKIVPRRTRSRQSPALAWALGVLASFLFSWPLMRVPRLTLGLASLHLFASWAAGIVVLLWMSRRLGDDCERTGDRDA